MRPFADTLLACGLTLCLLGLAFAQSRAGDWFTVKHSELCVTEGTTRQATSDRMSVEVPKMRAYSMRPSGESAELRFHYGGATQTESALGSGQMRRQFGLRLHAQDPCNLVYVIWRIDPESKLVISLKRNPSEHTSAQCGNRGYTNIKPRKSSPVPQLRAGESHKLRAEMKKEELRVFVDNHEVWEGEVGAYGAGLQGPVGIRSDNARLDFELLAREAAGDHPSWPCKSGDSD